LVIGTMIPGSASMFCSIFLGHHCCPCVES
jgi:hypothetical protein